MLSISDKLSYDGWGLKLPVPEYVALTSSDEFEHFINEVSDIVNNNSTSSRPLTRSMSKPMIEQDDKISLLTRTVSTREPEDSQNLNSIRQELLQNTQDNNNRGPKRKP